MKTLIFVHGPSGSGKTTLIDMTFRRDPESHIIEESFSAVEFGINDIAKAAKECKRYAVVERVDPPSERELAIIREHFDDVTLCPVSRDI